MGGLKPETTNEREGLETPELAFYYPGWIWSDANWAKNLVLFFDGIALLVPEYLKERPYEVDPPLVSGLNEHGLLKIIEPESFLDEDSVKTFASSMVDILASGALDDLSKRSMPFRELSMSRLGYVAAPGLADFIFRELEERQLAEKSKDGHSVPLHPMVHSLILLLLAQILRTNGQRSGFDLSPATDKPDVQKALKDLLSQPGLPTASSVISFDLEVVGVDLTAVPIDEILEFRAEHRAAYKKYKDQIRSFVVELSTLSEPDRASRFGQRAEEIREHAQVLKGLVKQSWRNRAAFSLGLLGAVWRAVHGDPVGALLAGGAAVAGADIGGQKDNSAYSFLFGAGSAYPGVTWPSGISDWSTGRFGLW